MNPREVEAAITDIELQIDRLRALYEQYFIGVEKLEPKIPRKTLERKLQVVRRERINNTAVRFRFQQVVQRWNTMQTYWRRVARQIEEGTYRPDVMRARARADARRDAARKRIENERKKQRGEVVHEVIEEETGSADEIISAAHFHVASAKLDTNGAQDPSAQVWTGDEGSFQLVDNPPPRAEISVTPSPSPAPVGSAPPGAASPPPIPPSAAKTARKPPPVPLAASRTAPPSPPKGQSPRPPAPPPSASGDNLSDDRMQNIYRDYVSARQQCNQNTNGVTYDKVSSKLRKQESALRKKHGKDVDFEVTVRGGKAILRAVRKK